MPPLLTHTTHQTMFNNELTFDQLQAVAGGATAIEYGLIAAAVPKENTGEAGDDFLKKNADSLRSDNRF